MKNKNNEIQKKLFIFKTILDYRFVQMKTLLIKKISLTVKEAK